MGEEGSCERKVMVAIEESEFSLYALKWVLDNLRDSVTKTRLLIFTAQPVPAFGYVYAASLGSARPELVNHLQEQQKKLSSTLLETAKNICASKGVIAEIITEVGDPKEAICNAVEKFKINLLILGNRGQGALKRAFVGSVSNYCVLNAKCPVLVVKKPE